MIFIDSIFTVLWGCVVCIATLGPLVLMGYFVSKLDDAIFFGRRGKKLMKYVVLLLTIAFIYAVGFVYFCRIPESVWFRNGAKVWIKRVTTSQPVVSPSPEQQ